MERHLVNFFKHIMEEDFASANEDLRMTARSKMRDRFRSAYEKIENSHKEDSGNRKNS